MPTKPKMPCCSGPTAVMHEVQLTGESSGSSASMVVAFTSEQPGEVGQASGVGQGAGEVEGQSVESEHDESFAIL